AAVTATSLSTQPPETEPNSSPRSDTASFAPTGRGAERRVATTVARATFSPRERPFSMVSASVRTRPAYRARARSLLRCGGRRGRRAVAVAEAEPVRAAAEGEAVLGQLAVDQVVEVLLEARKDPLLLGGGEPPRLHGGVELRLRVLEHGVLQSGDRLVLRLGDVGDALAAFEPRAQLGLGQAEVARGRVEAVHEPVRAARMPEPEGRPTEQRQLPGLDALLELLALLLGQAPVGDGRVDAVLERLLQRGAQLARL